MIYFVFPNIGDISLKKNYIYINISKLALVLSILETKLFFKYIENFKNIIAKLYNINFIIR